jgi:hypothetical protein
MVNNPLNFHSNRRHSIHHSDSKEREDFQQRHPAISNRHNLTEEDNSNNSNMELHPDTGSSRASGDNSNSQTFGLIESKWTV